MKNESKKKLSMQDEFIGTIENTTVFKYVENDSETVGEECTK
jgi:hypothetical protein